MGGIHQKVITQRHYFIHQAVVQHSGQILYGHFCCFLGQIGTTHITEEEGIAGEEGVIFTMLITQQPGGTFGGMSGRVKGGDGDFSNAEGLAIGGDGSIKPGLAVGP